MQDRILSKEDIPQKCQRHLLPLKFSNFKAPAKELLFCTPEVFAFIKHLYQHSFFYLKLSIM